MRIACEVKFSWLTGWTAGCPSCRGTYGSHSFRETMAWKGVHETSHQLASRWRESDEQEKGEA